MTGPIATVTRVSITFLGMDNMGHKKAGRGGQENIRAVSEKRENV